MAGVVSGLAVRFATLFFFANNVKVGGLVCGLWDGIALHDSLQRSRRRSTRIWNDPYNTIAVNSLLDFMLLGSLVRLTALLMGCGLGVVLADVIPQMYEELGFKAAFENLSQMQLPNVFGGFGSGQGSSSRYTLVVDPNLPPPSPRSFAGSFTTGARAYSRAPSVMSSVLRIPGSFRRPFRGRSVAGSVISTPTRPLVFPTSPQPAVFAFPPSPTIPPRSPGVPAWELDALPIPPPHLYDVEQPAIPEPDTIGNPNLIDMTEIPAEDMTGDPYPVPPNDGPIGSIDDEFEESVVRPPASVNSETFGSVLLSQANDLRQQANDAYARRDQLEQERKEAEAAGKPYEAFALKCQRDEAEEYGNKLNKKANSRYFAGACINMVAFGSLRWLVLSLQVRNAKKGPYTIDIHGLQEQEAIRRTERKLRDIQLDGGGSLRVITGNGDHHVPDLKIPLLQQMLKYAPFFSTVTAVADRYA